MSFSAKHLYDDSQATSVGGKSHSGSMFATLRALKRELLAEQQRGWMEGNPPSIQELLERWPTDPQDDADAAEVILEDLLQRRLREEDPSIDEYSERYPEHKHSLARLIAREEFLRSVGLGNAARRDRLSFPNVGDELFGFRFRAELGRGAFARVFLAAQIELAGRPVAVKVSAIEGSEPQTLAQMQHTHIVPIYAVHEDTQSGLRAVCMPYFGGASLSQVLKQLWEERKSPMHGQQLVEALERVQSPIAPPGASMEESGNIPSAGKGGNRRTPLAMLRSESYVRAVAWLAARLAEGLQHAHERGVLHRDIKPSNILIGADGLPMLLDFNLSQDQNDPAEAVLGGTVAYMSPEHLWAVSRRTAAAVGQVDHRSDNYSLGMVMFEMLAGERPFEQSGSYSILPAQLEAMAIERSKVGPSVRNSRPDVPWSFESILRKCLAPKPAERYQQAEHLAEDLQCFLEDRPLRHAPEPSRLEQITKWKRRHPRLTSAGSIGFVASLLLGVIGVALVRVQTHLENKSNELVAAQAEERMRAFEAGTMQALCLVNTTVGPQENLSQGVKVCEETLRLYDVLSGERWQEHPDWHRLSKDRRRRLAEEARELLLLLASAHVRLCPVGPSLLHQALGLLDRAEMITGLSPSRALWLDRACYLDALGKSEQSYAARRKAEEIRVATTNEHYLVATALLRVGGPRAYERALAELDKGLALDFRHYWSWLQRGICHTELAEYVLAAGDFGRCTALWPEFAWGHFNLGYAQAQSGQMSEAVLRGRPEISVTTLHLGHTSSPCDTQAWRLRYANDLKIWL